MGCWNTYMIIFSPNGNFPEILEVIFKISWKSRTVHCLPFLPLRCDGCYSLTTPKRERKLIYITRLLYTPCIRLYLLNIILYSRYHIQIIIINWKLFLTFYFLVQVSFIWARTTKCNDNKARSNVTIITTRKIKCNDNNDTHDQM